MMEKTLPSSLSYQDRQIDQKEEVRDLLSRMTLAEKVGQMTQVEKNSISPEEVSEYAIGSVLSGGGGNPIPNTLQDWANMVHGLKKPLDKRAWAYPSSRG